MNVDEALNQAFEALSDRLRAELQGAAADIAAAVRAQPVRRPESPIGDNEAASARMLDGIRSIGAARSLSEVLDTLASGAAHEATRAGVLLVRGWRLRGWRFVGFPPAFDTPATFDIAISDAGLIADAIRDSGAVSATDRSPGFADLPEGRRCLAVPIAVGGEVVAVLYADEGLGDAIESTWPHRVEIFARFAARCLEAITAFRTAQLIHRPPAAAVRPARSDNQTENGDPSDADAAARRYARLLVSEIKLYHEPEVLAGRRERDLAIRLGGEIARARMLYEQRVSPQIEQRADYFQAELVRTLADGDARLLAEPQV